MKRAITISFILLAGFFIIITSVRAQESSLIFDVYTTDHGLANNEITDVVQDEDGFIWVASQDGIDRFDGKDFVHFPLEDARSKSFVHGMSKIIRYGNHQLILTTGKGLLVFNTKTGRAREVLIPTDNGLNAYTNSITDILLNRDGKIIVSSLGGIFVFNDELRLVSRYDAYTLNDLGKKRIAFAHAIYSLPDGQIFVVGSDDLYCFDVEENKVRSVHQMDAHEWQPFISQSQLPYQIVNWSQQGVCVLLTGNFSTMTVIDFMKHYSFSQALPPDVINEMDWSSRLYFLNDSTFYISSSRQNGAFLFSLDLKEKNVQYKGKLLSGIQCNRFFIDQDNRLWAATNNGLYKQSFLRSKFHSIYTSSYGQKQDVENYVNGFVAFNSEVFVSDASRGVLLYSERDNSLKQIISIEQDGIVRPWSIHPISQDSLLVATQAGALMMNAKDKRWRRVWRKGMPTLLDSVAITYSFLDSRNQLWMGLGKGQGVFMIDRTSHHWKHFPPSTSGFPLRYPMAITEDARGNVWMSGTEGITRWNQTKQKFDTLITKIKNLPDEIIGHWISVSSDTEGNLWICPEAFVLVKWKMSSNEIKIFRTATKEGQFLVRRIDGPWQNRLWFPNTTGLLSFDIKNERFTMLRKTDGLPAENSLDGYVYYNQQSKRMYAGFGNVFTWFYPSEIFNAKKSAHTLITEVRAVGDSKACDTCTSRIFSHRQNFISISFTGINFDNGQLNTYSYRLTDNEPAEWISVGEQKTINFANLKPGRYTFEVKTIFSDGSESDTPAALSFTISPAFYQTWWFYLLCVIVISSIAYALYRYRINQLIRVQNVRNAISSDLHDDIGARLTNMNILALLGEQNLDKPEMAGKYLSKIAEEIQSSSQALDDIVWNINTKSDSLTELIARMRRYAADVFENTAINFQFQSDKALGDRKMAMEQRRDLFLIYKESIANIQKHANASVVDIRFSLTEDRLQLTICDNGNGFDVTQPTHRNGLENMRARVEKWKGDFKITSVPQQGTTVIISFL